MKKYLIIITAVALAFGTCREALAQAAEPEAVDGYAYVRTEPVDNTVDLDQLLEERRAFDRMAQASHDWSLSDADLDLPVILQATLTILCIIILGTVLGLIIMASGKLFHRVGSAERRLLAIEGQLGLKADGVNPSGVDSYQSDGLTGDEAHDTALIAAWIKEVDEAFPYSIPDPVPGEVYYPLSRKGPDGQTGKAFVISCIIDGCITSHSNLLYHIEMAQKEDRLLLSREKAIAKLYKNSK